MDVAAFRKRIREHCQPAGYSQKMLAHALNLHPAALSNKLNGTGETHLKQPDAREIIKVLAGWSAITTQADAIELLELVGMRRNAFSEDEWNAPPLNKLDASPPPAPQPIAHADPVSAPQSDPAPILPAYPTPLIGRRQEVADVAGLLRRADVRLVTLSGVGGVGKTRLAVAVAAALLPDFDGGAIFVSLAATRDPAAVAAAIGHILGVAEKGKQSAIERLKTHLKPMTALLVLDNFEQVVAAAPLIGELLAACPNLKILVTSRALLKVYGEYEYIVPPLTLPDIAAVRQDRVAYDDLAHADAVTLFVQRARAARHDFQLTPDSLPHIAEICARLDCLPLAIELAAAQVKLLALPTIVARLKTRLDLPGRIAPDLPARQHTLRNLLDWSYDLLNTAEKEALARLALWVGGFDMDGALAVCGGDAPMLVAALTDKSLLQVVTSENDSRFTMLETIREYAARKLSSDAEADVRRAQTAYLVALATTAEGGLNGAQQTGWLNRLEAEHANIRDVLRWAISHDPQSALELAARLAWFWDMHGHLQEGRRWLRDVLDAAEALDPFWRGRVLNAGGNLARKQGDFEAAEDLLRQSLALRRTLGSLRDIALTLNNLGTVAYHRGRYADAQAFYEECLALKRQLGDQRSITITLSNLAEFYHEQGRLDDALTLYRECLTLLREIGDGQNTAVALLNVGTLYCDEADYSRAIENLTEAVAILHEVGDTFNLAEAVEQLGRAIGLDGRRDEAARLFGAAESLRQSIGARPSPIYAARYSEAVSRIQAGSDTTEWQARWQEGRTMGIDTALALVTS